MNQSKYHNHIRDYWPIPFVEPWLWGPTNIARAPYRWRLILCTRLGNRSGWHYHKDEVLSLGKKLDVYLSNPINLRKFRLESLDIRKDNLLFAKRIQRADVSTLTLKQLAKLFHDWQTMHRRFAAIYMCIDSTDETLEAEIKSEILAFNQINNKQQISGTELSILLTPFTQTFVQKQQREFCELIKMNGTRSRIHSADVAIKKYIEKWRWSVMGYSQHNPLTENQLRTNMRDIRNIPEYVASQQEDERKRRSILKVKSNLLLRLPKQTRQLLNAFEVLSDMHDERKEVQMKMILVGFKVTKAMLERSDIPLMYRDFLLTEDYYRLAENSRPSPKELKARQSAFWYQVTSDGKSVFLSGRKASRKIKESKIYKRPEWDGNTIKGVSASVGKARARVRVGSNAQVLMNVFRTGEILVTGQTTPEFFSIMKKAAAIITDEGGITSHAAIFSRELRKPCIIGTKIATQVFKDGDLVEVDANNGVVRLLERKV